MNDNGQKKPVQVTVDDVAAGVRSIGVGPGDTVLFHSSLKSMGIVIGGPNAVIEGFLRAVGPGGTVAVPTLWWNGSQDIAQWDRERSPSYPGLITETFRRRPDSVRSDNPTHSVSAIGRRARELTDGHGSRGMRLCVYGDRAFAVASPWERLYRWNAHYCFLGVDFTVNTMGHYCQCLLVERALARAQPARRDDLQGRIARWDDMVAYTQSCRAGETPPPLFWPWFDFRLMGERLAAMGLVRFGRIGAATIRGIRTRAMVDTILQELERRPEEWLQEDFCAWLRDAMR